MRAWSLKWKLSFFSFLILTLVIVVLSVAAYMEIEEALVKNIDSTLEAMGEGALAVIKNESEPSDITQEIESITGSDNSRRKIRYRIWWENSAEDIISYDPVIDIVGSLKNNISSSEPPSPDDYRLFNIAGNTYRAFWDAQCLRQRNYQYCYCRKQRLCSP